MLRGLRVVYFIHLRSDDIKCKWKGGVSRAPFFMVNLFTPRYLL